MEVFSSVYKHFWVHVRLISLFFIIYLQAQLHSTSNASLFPPNFLFGAASSAYQYEGAYLTDGKGLSNWDVFTHRSGTNEYPSNGDVSIDFYHRYPEFIDLMVSVGLNSFQISISWARILPKGRYGGINIAGIDFYKKLLDMLLSKGIEPFVILHHFDIPFELEKRYGSWLSQESVEDFKYFADICFKNFGDKIKYWATFSEPNIMVTLEYEFGFYPPAHCILQTTGKCKGDPNEPFIAAHNIILAHAAAVKIYKTKYQEQGGQIGMSMSIDWFEPLSNSAADILAVERANSFVNYWFLDPIVFGRYPIEMIQILGNSLPKFSSNDSEDLKIGTDFIGINHYSSSYIWDCMNKSCGLLPSRVTGYVGKSIYRNGIPIGEKTGMENFNVYPNGMEKVVNYVKERFNNMPLYITENGYCEISDSRSTIEDSINDVKRVKYLTNYLDSITAAIRSGADLRGYFLWTLVDDFEWNFGYTKRYGIHHFDNETKKITPKSSATWYKQFIDKHTKAQVIVPKANPQLLQTQ